MMIIGIIIGIGILNLLLIYNIYRPVHMYEVSEGKRKYYVLIIIITAILYVGLMVKGMIVPDYESTNMSVYSLDGASFTATFFILTLPGNIIANIWITIVRIVKRGA